MRTGMNWNAGGERPRDIMDARTTSVVSIFTRWLCGDGRNWSRTGKSEKEVMSHSVPLRTR
eukprot:1237959-Pleurochrysis_carterae.AAC.1